MSLCSSPDRFSQTRFESSYRETECRCSTKKERALSPQGWWKTQVQLLAMAPMLVRTRCWTGSSFPIVGTTQRTYSANGRLGHINASPDRWHSNCRRMSGRKVVSRWVETHRLRQKKRRHHARPTEEAVGTRARSLEKKTEGRATCTGPHSEFLQRTASERCPCVMTYHRSGEACSSLGSRQTVQRVTCVVVSHGEAELHLSPRRRVKTSAGAKLFQAINPHPTPASRMKA